MLLIVNSMPKSGSTWFHHYTVRCLSALGHPTAHVAVGGRVALNAYANPGAISGPNLELLLEAAQTQTFAIKAHVPPNEELLAVLRAGGARMAFLMRHPADIVRSALAFAENRRSRGDDTPYNALYQPRQAADFVEPSMARAAAWLKVGPAVSVWRYQQLYASDETIRCAVQDLWPETASVSGHVLDKMRPGRLSDEERDRLRVNLTHRPELTDEVTARCAGWAARLGYA